MRTTVPGVCIIILIVVLSVFSTPSFSQSISSGNGKFEFGLGLGPLFFLGDLGGNQGVGKDFIKDVNLPLTKLSKGLYLNVYPAEWLGFRLAFNHGVLEGDDGRIDAKGTGPEQYRRERNLKFKTSMLEVYAATEFYPTVFMEKYDGLQGKLRPYGIAGIGVLKFNPKGQLKDATWVELQPLRLEGQGMAEYAGKKEYQLTTFEIPMGIGAKYYIKENMYVGLEILHRQTFSDYVDDVSTTYIDPALFAKYLTPSQTAMANELHFRENLVPNNPTTRFPTVGEQRGDSKDNDAFFSTILRFGWRLNDSNSPNGRAARQMRCPSFY